MNNYVMLMGCGAVLAACSGAIEGDEWESGGDFTSSDMGSPVDAPGAPVSDDTTPIGTVQQALIDTSTSGTGCFALVPPFIFPQDNFSLSIGGSFQPISLCGNQAGTALAFRIENFVRELGTQLVRPASATPDECADLQLFFAIGREHGPNQPKTIVGTGSRRGFVTVTDGVPTCNLAFQLYMGSELMPNDQDYFFAAQVLRDGGGNITEPVVISPD
jgi:hypothetical protein